MSKVHSQLRELVVHELNESLLVDGVRVFDPHEPVIDPGAKSTL